jgi:hypothetical protein
MNAQVKILAVACCMALLLPLKTCRQKNDHQTRGEIIPDQIQINENKENGAFYLS